MSAHGSGVCRRTGAIATPAVIPTGTARRQRVPDAVLHRVEHALASLRHTEAVCDERTDFGPQDSPDIDIRN